MKQKTFFEHYENNGVKTTVCFLWNKETQDFVKGIAVCRDGDTYNQEFGEKLARAKAVFSMRENKARRLQKKLGDIEAAKANEEKFRTELKYTIEKTHETLELIERLNNEMFKRGETDQ